MSHWIDTHAHIYAEEFRTDCHEMLSRSLDALVSKIFMPNVDHKSIDGMMELEAKYPHQCVATIGLHPCSVKKDFERELYLVEEWLNKRRFVAIGEMGTDLYWDKTFWPEQQEAFRIQVAWAKKYEVPLIIHCRESMDETIALLQPLADDQLTGVFHCFTGSVDQARKIAGLGFYLGVGGVATFKNSGMDKIIPDLPLSQLVLETDAPYLAPVPHRGKRNEPSFIPLIAERVAHFRKMSMMDLRETTTRNAEALFKNIRPAVNAANDHEL